MAKLRKLNFQLKGVRKIEHFNGRALLADEMGLGKTIQALLWVKRHPKEFPVIIICPSTMKWVWQTKLHEMIKHPCEILQGQKPPKGGLSGTHKYIIINYEILQYWSETLKKINAKTLIIDECHYQKSRTAIRTKEIKKLAKKIPHIIAISGTPLLSRPAELWTTISLIRPDIFPHWRTFADRYCKPKLTPWGWDYRGASHLRELHRILVSSMMIRRLKKDVLTELPDKTREVIPLDVSNPQEYYEAVENFIQWLSKKSVTKAKKAKKAQSLVKIGYLKRLAAKLKMNAAVKWVDDFLEQTDGKIVLICVHKEICNQLQKRYKKTCVLVDGSVTGALRKKAVRNFQNNPRKRVFIGNIKAAGVGITLTAAHSLAFIEMSWTPGEHTQAEDRIHRIGQKNAASIYYLIAKGTIEEDLCKVITKKQENVSKALNGQMTEDDLDVYGIMEKSLLRKRKEEK